MVTINLSVNLFCSCLSSSVHYFLVYSQKRIQKYNTFVNNHQEYTDSYNSCIEWLTIIKEKLNLCADFTGDKHAIQHRLTKIQVNFVLILLILYFSKH